jgi:phosphopantothenoylcysteine synthetase/decarboxylase
MPTHDLAGKKIAVIAGNPREDIDGVRLFANHSRPENMGYVVAARLAAEGADVTILAPKGDIPAPRRTRVVPTPTSAKDLIKATETFLSQNRSDAVLCLASIASIRPAHRAAQKIKAKGEKAGTVSFAIVGNVDINAHAKKWGIPAFGYNHRQEKFSTPGLPSWATALAEEIGNEKTAAGANIDGGALAALMLPNLKGRNVIVTSGPTEERVTASGDIITNFSSGRQGYEVARVFAASGAEVTFVTGPSHFIPKHEAIRIIRVTSAVEMLEACEEALPADVFVGVAAVGDFGCKNPPDLRLAEEEPYDLRLDPNPDILSSVGHRGKQRPTLVIGFAAETDPDNILSYAAEKLTKKNADLICANLVGRAATHPSGENEVIFVTKTAAPHRLSVMSKNSAAVAIAQEADLFMKKFSA